MKFRLLMIWLLLACSAAIADAAITFVYPQQKSWIKQQDHFILKLNSFDFTGVRVIINGVPSDILPIGTPEYRKEYQDFLIMRAQWDPGVNDVQVEGFKGAQRIEFVKTTIFFNAKKDPSAIPPEYGPNRFHVPESEKLCTPCHRMNPTQNQMMVGGNLDKSNPCFTCHRQMLQEKYVHGPAGTFSCGYCHAVQASPKYSVPKRDAALCNECHAEKGAEFKKRKFLHGPIDAGMCEVCHDPHGSPNPAQLKQPINPLCLSCHASIGETVHIVRTPAGKGHPLEGVPDPSKPQSGKEISCVSCHNPHSADVRYLFVNNAEDKMQLCQMCHNK
jgi:predicted CXXCH cytochrome family protein